MRPTIYWIPSPLPGRLAILARPRSGDWLPDEIAGWRSAGIHHVLSLLEPDESIDLGLQDEQGTCTTAGICWHNHPIPDRGLPSDPAAFAHLIATLAAELQQGRALGIHCRAGIGRSALAASAILITAGLTPSEALDRVSIARGVEVPDTEAQRRFILRLAPSTPR